MEIIFGIFMPYTHLPPGLEVAPPTSLSILQMVPTLRTWDLEKVCGSLSLGPRHYSSSLRALYSSVALAFILLPSSTVIPAISHSLS